MQGPGGYTNQSIREAYRRRVQQKLGWHQTGGHADTTEAAERAVVLAARYALNPRKVAETVSSQLPADAIRRSDCRHDDSFQLRRCSLGFWRKAGCQFVG